MSERTQGGKIHYAWLIFIGCCCLSAGGMALTVSITGVYLVTVSTHNGISPAVFALWLSANAIVSMILLPFYGRWMQKVNINVLATVAALIMILCVGSFAFWHEAWQFILFGGLMGLGVPPIFNLLTPTLMGNWFDERLRGRFLGIASAFTGVGTFIWAPVFTSIMLNSGYQVAYGINALLMAILLLPFTIFVFKLRPEDKGLEPYGRRADEKNGSEAGNVTLHTGMTAKQALRTAPFWLLVILAGFISLGMGMNNNQPAIAMAALSHGAFDTTTVTYIGSWMISIAAVGNIIGKILMGFLADKFGLKFAIGFFFAMFIISLIIMGLLISNAIVLFVAAFFLGTHNAFTPVGFPLIARKIWGDRDFPKIFSRYMMTQALFGGFATSVIAALRAWTGSFSSVCWILLVIMVIMAVIAFVMMRYIGKYDSQWECDLEMKAENKG